MNYTGTSDIFSSLQARHQSTFLTGEFNRLSLEISTGKSTNKIDTSPTINSKFASLNRSLDLISSYGENVRLLETEQNVKSKVLESLTKSIAGLGSSIVSMSSINPGGIEAVLEGIEELFSAMTSMINSDVAGRYIFSGQNSTTPPLESVDFILSQLESEIIGLNDPNSIVSAIDQWFFQSGGGFETLAYQGGAEISTNVQLSSTMIFRNETTATSTEIRKGLRDLSILVMHQRGSLPVSADEALQLVTSVGESLIESEVSLIKLSASVGNIQDRIDAARAQNSAEEFSFREAVNSIISIDLYQKISEFEQVRTQIESLYEITARASQLKFTTFIR